MRLARRTTRRATSAGRATIDTIITIVITAIITTITTISDDGDETPVPAARLWILETILLIEPLFGPDPGLLRLRTGARSVLSAGTTLACLFLLLQSHGASATAPIALGFMTSIFAVVAVRDPKPIQQALTMLLLAIPALAFAAFAAFIHPWPWIAEPLFVVVVMGAILARLGGSRGLALGMVAYIAYFICLIIKPPLALWPQLAAGVFVGLASTAAVRFLILPDRPQTAFQWAVRQTCHRIGCILAEAEKLLATEFDSVSDIRGEPHWRRIHQQIGRMHDATLLAEAQIADFRQSGEGSASTGLRVLFDVELAVERLAQVIGYQPPLRSDRDVLVARMAALRRGLSAGALGDGVKGGEPSNEPQRNPARMALGTLETEVARLCETQSKFAGVTPMSPDGAAWRNVRSPP